MLSTLGIVWPGQFIRVANRYYFTVPIFETVTNEINGINECPDEKTAKGEKHE